ncbi:hypothetical protein MOKP38_45890 [Mycobacterium avium subsp. hominissuis]
MPYRMKPHVELLIVKDQNGVLWHHYQNPSAATGARNLGPIIAWIGPEYLDRWLRLGLVEEISDESAAAQNRSTSAQFGGAPEPNSEFVGECIAALDRFDVPSDAGAPTCRQALRDRGLSFGNDCIAVAVRHRKTRAASLAETRAAP